MSKGGLAAYRSRIVAEKRGAALDAATRLFLADGYDRTSLEAVAKEAGVSSATVYKHFPTKADLFGGIMSRLWENEDGEEGSIPDAGDPVVGLTTIGRDYVRLLLEDQTLALFRVIIAEVPRFPELGEELYHRGKQPYLDRLQRYLESEIAAKTLDIGDVPLANRQFLGMINDTVFWPRLLISDLEMDQDQAERVVAAAVDTMIARYGA